MYIDGEAIFLCDGKTKYSTSSFLSKGAVEARLTNDERKQLLTIFKIKNQRNLSIPMLLIGIILIVIGLVSFCVSRELISRLSAFTAFIIPGGILVALGIYNNVTSPDINKIILKAYEFTITDMKKMYFLDPDPEATVYYETEPLAEVTHKDADKYSTTDKEKAEYFLCLKLGEKWVQPRNAESFSPVRFGIKIGDKVRCAVLEYGPYCYITLY